MRTQFVNRIRVVAVFIVLFGLFLIFRLYVLQVVHGSEFRDRAEGQYAIESSNHFDRGSIFFTPKDGVPISAATLDIGYTLAIVPKEIQNPDEVYTTLSQYLELDADSFFKKAAKQDDPYEEIARRIPSDVGHVLIDKNIDGVHLYRERWRIYPGGTAAAQTIGFLGYGSGNTLTGQYGLERFYDSVLTKPNTGLYVNFFADIFTNIRSSIFNTGDESGAHVITSIEPTVQSFLDGLVAEYQNEWHAQGVGAIVLDPATGDVIALTSLPTFDPNAIATADPNTFSNPLVSNVYEFGSIMKPLTVAAGIDAGVITPESTYTDNGFAVYDGSRINNYDLKGRGPHTTMQQVLSESLNTGVAYVAVEKLGTRAFHDYFDAFGILHETGIDLPNEAEPLVANFDSPRNIEYATASFGQGIALTPMAMARSLSTLANHGIVPSPHIATKLQYPGGFDKKLNWGSEKRAISEHAADEVTGMLVTVVDTALRGGAVKVPELSIAAKTGTAQIARPDARGYYDDRYLHSFFGYFPAYDARFLIFLYAVAPHGARYASETWTAPFMETVRFLVSYYDIPPDRAGTEL